MFKFLIQNQNKTWMIYNFRIIYLIIFLKRLNIPMVKFQIFQKRFIYSFITVSMKKENFN